MLYPQLDLGLDSAGDVGAGDAAGPGPLPIVSSRAGVLWDGLAAAYDQLGFAQATGRDEVFGQLVLARIIEPSSKLDSLGVLAETGIDPVASYATLKRRLPVYAAEDFRRKLAAACAAHARLGPTSLVLFDVSTLYFETDTGDGFREPGFSKECRLEPAVHHRAAHRRVRVSADGGGVRGQPGRDNHDAAHDPRVHGRPSAGRRDGRGATRG